LRIEAGWQALVILQHDNPVICATEFGFHGRLITSFSTGRQERHDKAMCCAATEKGDPKAAFPEPEKG